MVFAEAFQNYLVLIYWCINSNSYYFEHKKYMLHLSTRQKKGAATKQCSLLHARK